MHVPFFRFVTLLGQSLLSPEDEVKARRLTIKPVGMAYHPIRLALSATLL
jgi:hypothetical protein